VNRRFPKALRKPMGATLSALLLMILHLAPLMLRWWRRGDQFCSPYVDSATRKPRVEPVQLDSPWVTTIAAARHAAHRELEPAGGCG
jgi:hypothetical protein